MKLILLINIVMMTITIEYHCFSLHRVIETHWHYLYQFVHKGVAASQSLTLALLPSHLKTPTFCVV